MRKAKTMSLRLDLQQYEDKYVSLVDGKVAASDEDPDVAYRRAKQKYPKKEIILWKVIRGESFIFQVTDNQ